MTEQLPLEEERVLTFTVPGEVRGKGRPRFRSLRYNDKETGEEKNFVSTYTDAKTKKYENVIALAAMAAKGRAKWAMVMDEPLRVDIVASFLIPKSWSKRKRDALEGRPATNRIDADNVIKSLCDGCQNVLWLDDKVITTVTCRKVYVGVPDQQGLQIRVTTCV